VKNLPSDILSSHKKIQELQKENTFLREQLSLTRAKYFGKSSEKRVAEVSDNQLLLLQEVEDQRKPAAAKEAQTITVPAHQRKKRSSVEGRLPEGVRFPEHLERVEEVIDEPGVGELVVDKVSERLCARRSAFYVLRIVRRVRKTPEGKLVTPPLPTAVIERTTTDVSFLVSTILSKFEWHLPLYRQEQMLKAQGISLSRDTLIRYIISCASLLKPVYVALADALFEGAHLYSDETPVLVGKRKDKLSKKLTQSYFWGFLGKSGVVFYYTPTRAYKEIEPLIKSYSGHLQVDGYEVYEKLSYNYPEIVLVGCWAHARRYFIDAEKGGNASDANKALRFIRALYRVEARIKKKSLSPPKSVAIRQRFSKKILQLFHDWLKTQSTSLQILPKSLFGKAVSYTLTRWEALCRYTENAVLTIDSNPIERSIRPIALGKKNWLFCDSEIGAESAAILYSLIASCKMAGVDPWDYLTDVLERISVQPATKVAELIPENWKALIDTENNLAKITQQEKFSDISNAA